MGLSQSGSVVKKKSVFQLEMWVQSLGWEDPLQEEIATHPTVLAWKSSWTEESRGLQSKKLDMAEHACTLYVGELPAVFFICMHFPYCRNLKWVYRENVTGRETNLSNEESAGYCDLHMTGGPVHRMGSWCPGS